jgi:hypothetical protein
MFCKLTKEKQKRNSKEKGKMVKRPQGTIRPEARIGPRPKFPARPNRYPPSPSLTQTVGPTSQSSSSSVRNPRGDCRRPPLLPLQFRIHAYPFRPRAAPIKSPCSPRPSPPSLRPPPPPGCTNRTMPRRHCRRRTSAILVSPNRPEPTRLHHFLSLTPAHLPDMNLYLLALQSDEIVPYWISPSTGKAPTSNRPVSRSSRARRPRHCNLLDILRSLVRTSEPRNLSWHRC